MSFSPNLQSAFNKTQMRDAAHPCHASGMCSMCTADCASLCEIALSSVLGMNAVYPHTTGENQIASEKSYPIDYSHFNINGRVFGAIGAEATPKKASIWNVKLECEYGSANKIKVAMPVILPALIKLNWKDYFGGAAMAGVSCVIGESSAGKDPNLRYENGKVSHAPFIGEAIAAFNKYYRGYGQIILQCNYDDDLQGVPEYALEHCNATAIEFKFGQSAKGTQPAVRLGSLEIARQKQREGAMIYPDPSNDAIVEAYKKGYSQAFYSYGSLPMWDEAYLLSRIKQLRELGMKNVYFKMAGYDVADLEQVLRIGAAAQIDLVTFDGAGGGSGYSPCKMMNEWSMPTVCMQSELNCICDKLRREGVVLPDIAIAGGFATEDQAFKALALGGNNISLVGICRAAMAAAMSAKRIGEQIGQKNMPPELLKLGSTKDELFLDLPQLRGIYGEEANEFSLGAVGVFSYLNRIAFGLQHFAALNRKFDIKYIDKTDLIALTREARDLIQGEWLK